MLVALFKEKLLRLPYILTVSLLMAGLGTASFFTGTDTYWFFPPLVAVFLYVAYVIGAGFRDGWDLPRGLVIYSVLAFGLYVVLSVTWASVPYISGLFAYILGSLPLLFMALVLSPRAGEAVRVQVAGAFVVFCALAVWAWVQQFILYDQYGPRIHSPMLSPNSLAAFFVMGFFFALGLYTQLRGKAVYAGYALVMLFMIALAATQSRGAMTFTVVSFIVFVSVMWRAPGVTWKRMTALVASVPPVFFLINHFSEGRLAKNIASLAQAESTHSFVDRMTLAQSTFQMLKDHFWTGIGGAGTFYFNYPAYRSPKDFSDGFFTHMDPLQYGAEMGILAPILFYTVLCAVLWRTIMAVRATTADSRVRAEIMTAFCAMLAILIHTHMDFHLYILVTLIAMAFPLAWWYVATEDALGARRLHVKAPSGPVWVWRAAATVMVCLVLVWPGRAAVTTLMFPEIQQRLGENNMPAALAAVDKVAKISPRSYYRLYQYRGRAYTQMLISGQQSLPREEAQKLYDLALAAFNEGVAYNPNYTGIRSDRAKLFFVVAGWLDVEGNRKAQQDLETIVDQNPLDWDARVGLVKIYERQGYFSKAQHVLERGREWPLPKGPMGLQLLLMEAGLYQKMGDKQGQAVMMNKAKAFAISNGLVANAPAPTTAPAAPE